MRIQMRIYLETYGCTANEADSAGMREAILASGGIIVTDPREADTIIVNTCAVTRHTSASMLKAIGKYEGKKVIVAGCMAVAEPDKLKGFQCADAPGHEAVLKMLGIAPRGELPVSIHGRTAVIKIAEGCLGQCSYCVVRLVRGTLKSVPEIDVESAVLRAIRSGASEIFLTAQDTGVYGADTGSSLPGLIRRISALPGDYRVRIGMMNPFSIAGFMPELIDVLQKPNVYRFLHVPVQSGSNRILRLMNRPYTGEEYSRIVSRLKAGVPGITLSTDYIVGFPTESAEDFRLTMEELAADRPLKVNITRFSPRPGTPAADMPDVLERIKKERSRALTALHHEITSRYMHDAIGSTRTVLVSEPGKTGTMIARDNSYNMVVLHGEYEIGDIFDALITGSSITYMTGKPA